MPSHAPRLQPRPEAALFALLTKSSGSCYYCVMNLGAPELLIVLVVILVLFGGAKLPKLARSLGQAQKEFKDGLSDGLDDEEKSDA